MEIHELINCVREWGAAKGLTGPEGKATERGQLFKLLEEVGELQQAIRTNNKGEKIDAIGDCTVALILLSEIIGISFEDCLDVAYQVISKRTGRMENGQFIKD